MNEFDKLYEEWKITRPEYNLVNDGILDSGKWASSKSKIQFLLKESHGFTNIRNKSHDITAGDGNHFWYNITRWWLSVDMHYSNQHLEFPSNNHLKKLHPLISDIAYVNVKKTIGKSRSTAKDIMIYAKKDKDLLRRQIDLIAPKVVITDKTTFNAYKVIYANDTLGIDKTSNPRVFSHGNRYIIRFYHPSYFGKKAIWLFNELQKCLDVINNHK